MDGRGDGDNWSFDLNSLKKSKSSLGGVCVPMEHGDKVIFNGNYLHLCIYCN